MIPRPISDSRMGRRADRPSGHSGTMPRPRPDHSPIPSMAQADNTTEKAAEVRADDETVRDCEAVARRSGRRR